MIFTINSFFQEEWASIGNNAFLFEIVICYSIEFPLGGGEYRRPLFLSLGVWRRGVCVLARSWRVLGVSRVRACVRRSRTTAESPEQHDEEELDCLSEASEGPEGCDVAVRAAMPVESSGLVHRGSLYGRTDPELTAWAPPWAPFWLHSR